MRKIAIAVIIAFFGFIFGIGEKETKAQAIYQSSYCKDPIVRLKDPLKIDFWDYTALKERPNFVLDYFQDPNETGVDITVKITTTELEATYWYEREVCEPYDTSQRGMSRCTPDGGPTPGVYYYWTSRCMPQTETTFRTIETSSISIWLEPTRQTLDLLGPGPYLPDTDKPVLRYLYPDQWAVIIVNPGEMTIVEKSWFKDPDDVIAFLKKNKDYALLESDAKEYELTSRLAKMTSPLTHRGALGLMNLGNCWANISKITHDVCSSEEGKDFKYGVTEYKIMMERIPLDVPGEWYIGVSFYLWPAKFDEGRGTEHLGTGEYRQFVYSSDLMEQRYSFESYILRSAPCNPEEPGGCWDL